VVDIVDGSGVVSVDVGVRRHPRSLIVSHCKLNKQEEKNLPTVVWALFVTPEPFFGC
jgi:hypothetical protein